MDSIVDKHLKLIKQDLINLNMKASNNGKPSLSDMYYNGKILEASMPNIIEARSKDFVTEVELTATNIEQADKDLDSFISGIEAISVDFLRMFS